MSDSVTGTLVAGAVAMAEKPTAIAKVNAAVASIKAIEVQIAEFAQLYGGKFEVTSPEGMMIAKNARKAVREPRLEIERIRIEAKRDLLAVGKGLDSVAATLTAQILAIETPIAKVIEAEEKRIEDEKQAAIAAEAKRVEDCRSRIENIAMLPVRLSGKTAEEMRAALAACRGEVFAPELFREMLDAAFRAQTASLDALERLLAQRVEFEQQQAEAAELRKKQERADAIERERVAEEARKAKEIADAAAAVLAAEQAQLAADRAAFEAAQAAEIKRVADAQALLDAQQAEFEAQRQAEEEARKPAQVTTVSLTREQIMRASEQLHSGPVPPLTIQGLPIILDQLAQSQRLDPTAGEIVDALAERFSMARPSVLSLLRSYDWEVVRC
jgi:hypothetical protein